MIWFAAATALMLTMVPCGWVCLRAGILDALVALELAGLIATLALLVVAQGVDRAPFFDIALVSAVLSFAGGLAFARFLERWV